MNLITVVNAHGQGYPSYARHIAYWVKCARDGEMLTVCPVDDPIENAAIVEGFAQHNGRESWKRFQRIFKELEARSWDWCVMHEFDSFCLDARLPEHRGFYGNVFLNKEMPKFMAPRYANPPWTFDRMTFTRMKATADRYQGLYENGEADRYFSALAMLSGAPILDYEPKGFSRGTIAESDMSELRKAIHEGAYAIHGVKSAWALQEVERFKAET